MVKRSAMTMIELIFAIVLIAIVVAAVPQMMQRNEKTLEGNLVQQELFVAAKTASELLTQPWDTNAPDTSTSRAYTKVLDTNRPGFNRVTDGGGNLLPFRKGHIRQPNHRRFHNNVTYPADYKIPNMANSPALPANTALTVTSGYSGETDTTVFSTAPTTSNTAANRRNIKMANITVTDTTDNSRTVTLRLYMANIGEVAYAHRIF